ncbi:MAG: ATP-binding protein [Anaerolineales bacterium]|nr:ATP-binding protein [Chloroflexota bacterium]MBL6982269.1 ATP-binding protein [Anaerolineales bacterium]
MAIKGRAIPPLFPKDLIHINRWMCPNCGLIFDFDENHYFGEPGWINTDPPDGQVDIEWEDEDGVYHTEELDYTSICSRCGISLDDNSLIRVLISRATNLDDWIPIIKQSEHYTAEFKLKLSGKDVDKLGKEFTSFASSTGGRIFLGVDKYGKIQGFEGIDSPEGKDTFQQRIRGIVSSNVSPIPFYQVDFASDKTTTIAVITVPKGVAPFYSFKNVPYIRELETSRPATQEETTQLVLDWKERGS